MKIMFFWTIICIALIILLIIMLYHFRNTNAIFSTLDVFTSVLIGCTIFIFAVTFTATNYGTRNHLNNQTEITHEINLKHKDKHNIHIISKTKGLSKQTKKQIQHSYYKKIIMHNGGIKYAKQTIQFRKHPVSDIKYFGQVVIDLCE